MIKLPTIFQFLTRNRYRKELTLVVICKLVALLLLSVLFMSFSVEAQLEKPQVVRHYMAD
ncbi:MAG: hypothetical protein EPO11_05760 [Gammaproteobacteria bacterium]|nr:MAG: hypothetical protein EPO11_05760 [Gammaproteobacteria bacterium]